MNNSLILWFCSIFFFLILEMGHPGLLYFISFSCGALAAFVATWYGFAVSLQFAAFIVGTCAALYGIHFFTMLQKNKLATVSHRSNTDALIGLKVVVFQSLQDSAIWQTKIAGQVWQVQAVKQQTLTEGQQAIIVGVQGCHLKVDIIK